MNAVAPKERTNMFLDRLAQHTVDLRPDHAKFYQQPSTKAVHCARMLLGTSSYKRKLQLSPIGCFVDVHPSDDDCESDISDSEGEDEDDVVGVPLQESRWSSNPCFTSTPPRDQAQKSLRKVSSVDTAMTLPTRKPSSCNLKNLVS